MSVDSHWALVFSALAAAFLLWHLVSGRVPIGEARLYRRDAPVLYWFQLLVLAACWTLVAILLHFGDRRALILFFTPILICNLPGFLRETLPRLAKGNVPDSDDRVGRAFFGFFLTLFTLAGLGFCAWILVDVARNPPW